MTRKIAILICFDTNSKKFKSNYERNIFYRELYGYRQVVTKKSKTYKYEKEGILTNLPHLRIDNSSFIVPKSHMKEIERFFDEWEDKVHWRMLRVLMDDEMENEF